MQSSITKEEFVDWVKGDWPIPTVSRKVSGHPAAFPIEIPNRLIKLYSFIGDTVLDPFAGSGTTCVAAKNSSRNFIGFELSSEYCKLAMERINK
jgi:DNA modification methylase